MTRKTAHRSVSLAVLVVLAAAVGAVGAIGTVGAQESGTNTTANATDGDFYHPSDEHPINARFRDCCANTVDSVDEGVLNLYIVNGLYDGDSYSVDISASNLSEEQIDGITFDNDTEYSPYDLDRSAIVGMNFTGVPAGNYDFTIGVIGADAQTTVPLSVTGESEAANEATGNETAGNETMNGSADTQTETSGNVTGNTTVVATPSAANTSANYTVSTVVGADAAGNLSKVTISYGESNASIGLVGGNIYSATLDGQSIANNTTLPTVGAQGRNLTIGFDGTVQVNQGDRLNLTFGGITNPPEAGNYTVGVVVNNGSFQNTTLQVSANETSAGNGTDSNETGMVGNETGGENGTAMGNATGNATVIASPSAANTSANYTVSTVVGADAAGNLSKVTVNFGTSNASIGLVGGNIYSATLNGQSIANNTTLPTVGAQGRNLTIGFDGTMQVNQGDRLNLTFGGVTNPPEAGNYTVGVVVNNGSFQNTTLVITENTTAGMGDANATTGAGTTAVGTETTTAGTTGSTSGETQTTGGAGTSGAGTSGAGGATNGSGGQQGTEAGGPGFGIAIAVVALLAAALLAVRRN